MIMLCLLPNLVGNLNENLDKIRLEYRFMFPFFFFPKLLECKKFVKTLVLMDVLVIC